MSRPLRVLILEDRLADADLMIHELRRGGFVPDWRRVDTEQEYLACLEPPLDLILADYSLPQFDALRALHLLRERALDIPFIIVSGSIGEEVAVSAVQQGATDYLLKDRLARLGAAVAYALEQRRLRDEKRHADQLLSDSEKRFRALIEHSSDSVVLISADVTIQYASPSTSRILGYTNEELVGHNAFELIHPDDRKHLLPRVAQLLEQPGEIVGEQFRALHKDGSWRWMEGLGTNLLAEPSVHAFVVNYRDITARRGAEEALREAEMKYRMLVERIPAITYIAALDEANSTLYISPQIETVLGFSQAEWLADPKRWLKQLHPRDLDQVLAEVARSKVSDMPIRSEFRMLARDGRVIWFRDEAVVVRNVAGQPLFLQGVMLDITEHKQAEQRLAERGRLAALSAAVGVALTQGATLQTTLQLCADALVCQLDAAFARIWTLDHAEQVLELQASAGISAHSDDADRRVSDGTRPIGWIAQARQPLLTHAGSDTPQSRAQDGAGCAARGAFAGYPLIVEDRLVGVLALGAGEAFTPATLDTLAALADVIALGIEHKRAEEALRQSEELYRLITENTGDLISVIDQRGRTVYASPSFRHVLGYDPAEVLGVSGIDLVHPEDLAAVREQWSRLATQGTTQATLRYRHADGSWRWIEARGTTIVRQKVLYIVNMGRDVTERRNLEAQLVQAQKMESIGRLAGGVAHDFNNLLTAITGYAELALATLPSDTEARGDLDEILRAANRAATLTHQLLAFARKQIVAPQILNLNDLIGEMDKLLRRLISEDIELILLPAPDLGQTKADPGQIEQVLVNLVVNARDAMPSGGKLIVETSNVMLNHEYASQHIDAAPGAHILLAVSDTGIGMDEAVKRRLFEPFFTTKEPGKGTGLGLATCYGIVKQSGGHICVYSEFGHGTTFKIYLPCVEETADVLPLYDDPHTMPRGVETVLLVEDEPSVRELAARVLRERGYTVLEAANGHEALRVARKHSGTIQLLLTDVVMPQMSGKIVVERLKAVRHDIKVLAMSGYTDTAFVHHGWLNSGVAFLQKPFSPAALACKVREVLDTSG